MVGAEPLQAVFDLVQDRIAAEIAVHRLAVLIEEMPALLRVPDKPAFRGDHRLVRAARPEPCRRFPRSARARRPARCRSGSRPHRARPGLRRWIRFHPSRPTSSRQSPRCRAPPPRRKRRICRSRVSIVARSCPFSFAIRQCQYPRTCCLVGHQRIQMIASENTQDRSCLVRPARHPDLGGGSRRIRGSVSETSDRLRL